MNNPVVCCGVEGVCVPEVPLCFWFPFSLPEETWAYPGPGLFLVWKG